MRGADRSAAPDGIWNIASGVETTVNALTQVVADALHVVPMLEYGPAQPGDVHFSRLSNDKIVRDGWWQPRYTLAEGITETLSPSGN